MNLASRKVMDLDQEKIDLLSAVGNQIAVAVNNTKLYDQLETKIETLKEKKEMIQHFAYSLSHDLKSPATSLYGLTKRLQKKYKDNLDEKGRTYCEQILKASEQIVALVEDINAYITAKETSLIFEKINIKEVMETIRNEFSERLKQRQIKWSEPEVFPEIMANRLALIRVFRNLADNALKYGGDGLTEITVGCEDRSDYHTFFFRDDGTGMKSEDKDAVFKIFQRQETSHGIPGSGLGLAIVREIAEAHRGEAWVESRKLKGTTVYISISKDLNIME